MVAMFQTLLLSAGSLLAVAATSSAQTYAPLITPEGVVKTTYTAPNFFGGDVTGTFTVIRDPNADGIFQPGDFVVGNSGDRTYIDGGSVNMYAYSVVTINFSESITQLHLGWLAGLSSNTPSGPVSINGFNYTVFDGATQVDAGFVANMITVAWHEAYLLYSRAGGFTSISISADPVAGFFNLGYSPSVVPEPSTYGLMAGGLALAAVAVRRRKKASK